MSHRKSSTTHKFLQKSYSSEVKGLRSTKSSLLKISSTDSLADLVFKFKLGSNRNKSFVNLWNEFENARDETVGYFFGTYKIFSDNYKTSKEKISLDIKRYLKDSTDTDLFDYLENYLKLKRRK